jgi:hypothetical protein
MKKKKLFKAKRHHASVQQIKDIYGDNVKENIGTAHDYLGMTCDYLFSKEVQINM